MNLYGFKKIKIDKKTRYRNIFFKRDEERLLENVRRKRREEEEASEGEAVLEDLKCMEKRFKFSSNLLEEVKQYEKKNKKLEFKIEREMKEEEIFREFVEKVIFAIKGLIDCKNDSLLDLLKSQIEEEKFSSLRSFLKEGMAFKVFRTKREEFIRNLEEIALYIGQKKRKSFSFRRSKEDNLKTKKTQNAKTTNKTSFESGVPPKEINLYNSRSQSFDLEFFRRIYNGSFDEKDKGFDYKFFEEEMNFAKKESN